MRILIAFFLSLIALPLAAQNEAGGDWPFGSGHGPLAGFSGQDLHNLGLIGAKVRDADVAEHGPRTPGRRVSRMKPGADDGDEGPHRLLVKLLFPGGAAHKAGLRAGDVIVGVNGSRFAKGSLGPLARALVSAEAKTGTLVLLVERVGKRGRPTIEKLKLKIKKMGAAAARPTTGKGRRALVKASLDWLRDRQSGDGGFAQTLSGTNGAVVQAAVAGLAWVGGSTSVRGGRYGKSIDSAVKFISRNLDAADPFGTERGGASWNQTNWGYVHAALFLSELLARGKSGRVKVELQRICDEISKRQEASGGWAHGPGGKNALDYLELNIVSGLAVSALGAARRVGIDVDETVVKRAAAYLEASSGGGGVGYSTAQGQKGQGNIGRTAAAWLGYVNLGHQKLPWVQGMRRYVSNHAGDALGGHASLMQHILLAGVASQAQGKTVARKFWETAERDLILARSPDGFFQPRPWHESLALGSNSDVSFGEVWTTAAWAIILVADPKENKKAGLPVWTGNWRKKRS